MSTAKNKQFSLPADGGLSQRYVMRNRLGSNDAHGFWGWLNDTIMNLPGSDLEWMLNFTHLVDDIDDLKGRLLALSFFRGDDEEQFLRLVAKTGFISQEKLAWNLVDTYNLLNERENFFPPVKGPTLLNLAWLEKNLSIELIWLSVQDLLGGHSLTERRVLEGFVEPLINQIVGANARLEEMSLSENSGPAKKSHLKTTRL